MDVNEYNNREMIVYEEQEGEELDLIEEYQVEHVELTGGHSNWEDILVQEEVFLDQNDVDVEQIIESPIYLY